MIFVGILLMAIGLVCLVQGFNYQSSVAVGKAFYAVGWYFIGLLLLVVGKFTTWQSHAKCPVHKM